MNNPVERAELGLQLLVLRAQTGDEGAFAELLGRFGLRTLRVRGACRNNGADGKH